MSWSHFACKEITTTQFSWKDLPIAVASKMDHVGSIFDLPASPVDSSNFGEGHIFNDTRQPDIKQHVASKVLNECLERAKVEAGLIIRDKFEKEGLDGLKSILNGGSIFAEIGRMIGATHESKRVS